VVGGKGRQGLALICGREKKGPDQHTLQPPDPDLARAGGVPSSEYTRDLYVWPRIFASLLCLVPLACAVLAHNSLLSTYCAPS
jgi:hypothetical protein